MPYYGGVAQRTDPKFLMDRLMKNGMSRMHAAALVGNLQRESSLISNNMNKEEGAYGLMQWRGSRFTDLQQFAASKGVPWTDPGVQADFIPYEMANKERKGAAPFLAARNIDEASAGLKSFIRYGDKSLPERQMHARNFFGAADRAPDVPAAPPQAPQPSVAQPVDVSRETKVSTYAGDPYARAYAPEQRRAGGSAMRSGLESLGGMAAAYIDKQRRTPDELTVNPWSREGILGDSVAGARGDLAPQPTAPSGAPEPPRFPGGIVPMPRQRPMTGPGIMQGDYIGPAPTVAELGSLVDPTRYGYG